MTPFIVSLLVKATLILALGLIVTASLRSFGPSFRHQVLLVTLGSCLALPALIVLAPAWDVRVLPSTVGANVATPSIYPVLSASEVRRSNPSGASAIPPTQDLQRSPIQSGVGGLSRVALLPIVWAVGFLSVLMWLVAGRIRLHRIASASWPLNGDWERVLREESKEAGVSKSIRLLSSSVVSTPLTWGWRSPIILVPEDAPDWSEAHRRVVLRHELAHVARGDAFAQLLAGFVCAVYWFHPLVWIVERRVRAECERACDDRVVSLGTPAADYAAHLLEVARSARSFGAPGFLSVAMARPSQLEGRLLAVLNESERRATPSRGMRVAALVASALLLMTVSAFRAVPRTSPALVATSAKAASPVVAEISVPSQDMPRTEQTVSTKESPAAAPARASLFDSTFQRSAPARNGGTLNIDLHTGGHVRITGWDKQEASLQASLGGPAWRTTAVTFDAVDGGVRLESRDTDRSSSQSYSHSFDLNVPRNFNVRIKSAGGGVTIAGVDGIFTGTTGGGEIEIRKANGKANIKTGGGEIRVSDSRLSGSVSTGGGKVLIERVDGDFSGYSGSGPVTYINSNGGKGKGGGQGIGKGTGDGASVMVGDGATVSISNKGGTTTTITTNGVGKSSTFGFGGIRMSSAGGGISLPEAPEGARVTTGGGPIVIGPSAGEVYASTGGGSIDIGPARGSVEAHTGAGDVTITLTGAGSHSVDVTSGRGQVVLVLPRDLSATLEIETAYTDNLGRKTRIESELPLTITETTDWDRRQGTPRRYVRGRQIVGGGLGVIRVRTVNGNVILRWAN